VVPLARVQPDPEPPTADAVAPTRLRRSNSMTQPLYAVLSTTVLGATAVTVGASASAPDSASMDRGPIAVDRAASPVELAVAAGPAVLVPDPAPTPPAVVAPPRAVQVADVVGQATAVMREAAARQVRREIAAGDDDEQGRRTTERETARRTENLRQTAAGQTDAPEQQAEPSARTASRGVGARALQAAKRKLGKPYLWGAAGPNAFDCSGLVQWAFAQAGVKLPHSSRTQSTIGTRVARHQLQPGDLVFSYSPVSHVGIYLGDGKIIAAPQTGQSVKVSTLNPARFTIARRI